MDDVFLSIDGDSWKTFEKEGLDEYKAEMGGMEDSVKGSMQFTNLGFYPEVSEIEFKEGKLYIQGDLKHGSNLIDFGYLSVSLALPMETVIEIIEFYLKKLGKLKTILEATKNI